MKGTSGSAFRFVISSFVVMMYLNCDAAGYYGTFSFCAEGNSLLSPHITIIPPLGLIKVERGVNGSLRQMIHMICTEDISSPY